MNHPAMKITSWLLVFAIIGVSVWWWQTQYGGEVSLPSFHDEPAQDNQAVISTDEAPVVELKNGTAQLILPKLEDQAEEPVVEQNSDSDQAVEADEALDGEPEYLSEEEIKKLQASISRVDLERSLTMAKALALAL